MTDRTTLIRRTRTALLGAAWLPALAFGATPQDLSLTLFYPFRPPSL
ncbi:hypothetical protein [Burkholderia cenocepacia]|nr:hypothetical protein [Burkholderia cenocepacia]